MALKLGYVNDEPKALTEHSRILLGKLTYAKLHKNSAFYVFRHFSVFTTFLHWDIIPGILMGFTPPYCILHVQSVSKVYIFQEISSDCLTEFVFFPNASMCATAPPTTSFFISAS
jgi:hypothetical protein